MLSSDRRNTQHLLGGVKTDRMNAFLNQIVNLSRQSYLTIFLFRGLGVLGGFLTSFLSPVSSMDASLPDSITA